MVCGMTPKSEPEDVVNGSVKWFFTGKWFLAGVALLVVVVLVDACARRSQEAVSGTDSETELRSEVEDLKRAVNTSYDRERALAERLQSTEETNAQLRRELEQQLGQLGTLKDRLDTLSGASPSAGIVPPRVSSTSAGVPRQYEAARALYSDRHYDRALVEFAAILSRSPGSELADNAQYWIGECYYGTGRFRQALTEFTKVFAYRKTEKEDDAQLKIARCYLSLGEKDRALMALRKLIDEYPDSEYVAIARKDIRYLEGP